ncbi:unnamed protein product [Polarella glacialis]|uniref:Helicase ATP-binding domain-containing protein n=1 Tax=Polarella glacialis TaxID=89957 RepID=A0A813KJ92_POLGL|nr:unnamed protein product [Polarella glacialis]
MLPARMLEEQMTMSTPPISGPKFGFEHLECGEEIDYGGHEKVELPTPPLNSGRSSMELLTTTNGRSMPSPSISDRKPAMSAEPGPCERHNFQEVRIDFDTSNNKEYTVQPSYGNRSGIESEEDQNYVKLVGKCRMRIQVPAACSRFGTPWSRWEMCQSRGAWRIAPGLVSLIQVEGLRCVGGSRPSLCQQYVWPPLIGGAIVCCRVQPGIGRITGYLIPGIMKILRTLKEEGVSTMQGPIILIVVSTREQCRQVQSCCAEVAKVKNIHSIGAFGGERRRTTVNMLWHKLHAIDTIPGELVRLRLRPWDRCRYIVIDGAHLIDI